MCASWFFEDCDEKFASSSRSKNEALKKILHIFSEEKMLIINQLKTFWAQPPNEDTSFELAYQDENELFSVVDTIVENFGETIGLKFFGSTIIFTPNGVGEEISNCIEFAYDLSSKSLTVNFIEDVWTPVTKEWEWQIDIAEMNSERLPRFLKRIITEVGYQKISPNEGEICREFFRPMKGFKVYILEDDFLWTHGFYPCPPEKLEFVRSFILDQA